MNTAKRAAAKLAAELIQPGQIVGLGSGSTAALFIEELASRRLALEAVVASSKESEALARQLGLPLRSLNDVSRVDIAVDGADEIDALKRMIKGGGGAHVREKILAFASDELVVIVDETKLVPLLGKGKLPVEILPFGALVTQAHLESLGFEGSWRDPFITDNGNRLFDIRFPTPLENPEEVHEEIRSIPGVVDTGFFFGLAKRVIIGRQNGKTVCTDSLKNWHFNT